MSMNEQWKKINGYSRYEVSNRGKIRNIHTKKEKSTRVTAKGYVVATLKENGIRSSKYIHRLVAEAFISNPKNLPQVNHKDENKQNNNVENLEWCNAIYNVNYGTGIERRTKKIKGITKNNKSVIQKDKDGNIINAYISTEEAGRKLNVCSSHIGQVANGKRKTAGGYIWEWK